MKHLVAAVEQAIDQGNWYAALSVALTMPDICARMEQPEVKSSKKRYTDWCDRYLTPRYTREMPSLAIPGTQESHVFLGGGDCYALRCAVLHEGLDSTVTQNAREALDRFTFIAPSPGGFVHMNQSDATLHLQVDQFCRDICSCVSQWLNDVSEDRAVQGRLADLMEIRILGDQGFAM